jgi:hypothetical protein
MRIRSLLLVASLPVVLTACETRLTWQEAKIAAEESALSSQAAALTASSIEIATDFTIGQAVEDTAEQIRTFIETQLPCAETTITPGHLEVEYGVNEGNCVYRGHEFSGAHAIDVEKNEVGNVIVHHEWTDLSNGIMTVSGTATVTWDSATPTRHVVHELTWTRLADGRTGHGAGDRTQRPLNDDLTQGIVVDGSRTWRGESGTWTLAINEVEMRWIDPVPQDGSYSLDTPFDKAVSLSFDRVDENTIRVTVKGPKNEFDFDVTSLGEVE